MLTENPRRMPPHIQLAEDQPRWKRNGPAQVKEEDSHKHISVYQWQKCPTVSITQVSPGSYTTSLQRRNHTTSNLHSLDRVERTKSNFPVRVRRVSRRWDILRLEPNVKTYDKHYFHWASNSVTTSITLNGYSHIIVTYFYKSIPWQVTFTWYLGKQTLISL